ncbi:MAG TPA: hypothetical protein VJJ72_00650 [Candidatus Paceibacterota bacterium]
MSKLSLDNLFGSKLRVKVLKFVFRNYPADFNILELARRIQEPFPAVKKEIDLFRKMGLVKRK